MKYILENRWSKPRHFDNASNLVDSVVCRGSLGYDEQIDRVNSRVDSLITIIGNLVEVLNLDENQLSEILGEKVKILLE